MFGARTCGCADRITSRTYDHRRFAPDDPTVTRDAKGRRIGLLLMEGLQSMIEAALPEPTDTQRRHLPDLATRTALSAGVTNTVVVGGQNDLHLFSEARHDHSLKLRVAFAQRLTRDDATSAFPHDFAFDERDADRIDASTRPSPTIRCWPSTP